PLVLARHDTHLFDGGLLGADAAAQLRRDDLSSPQPGAAEGLNVVDQAVAPRLLVLVAWSLGSSQRLRRIGPPNRHRLVERASIVIELAQHVVARRARGRLVRRMILEAMEDRGRGEIDPLPG